MDEGYFENWSRDTDNILKISLNEVNCEPIPVAEACARAVEVVDSEWFTTDWHDVPLFTADGGQPTDEFVQYDPDQEILRFNDINRSGLSVDSARKLRQTNLAQRLKWWLPEHTGDVKTLDESQLPPEKITPVDKLSETDRDRLFREIRRVVEAEQQAAKESNRDAFKSVNTAMPESESTLGGPLVPTHGFNDSQTFSAEMVPEDDEVLAPNIRDDAGVFEDSHYLLVAEGTDKIDLIEAKAIDVDTQTAEFEPIERSTRVRTHEQAALTDSETTLWAYQLVNTTPFRRRIDATAGVRSHNEKRNLIAGTRNVRFQPNKYAIPDPPLALNDSQERALVWAKAAKDCVCIHGPPGTGKTRTLTAYIHSAVQDGQRVLITAHSNQAVDNLLVGDSTRDEPEDGTLHALAQDDDADFTITRAGNGSENAVVQEYYTDIQSGKPDIVATTTNGAANFSRNEFDVAIVDEATQASRAATLIPFNAAKKLVLAGDHKQLPPFQAAEDPLDEGKQRPSLFEVLLNRYGDDIAVMLTRQYRMNEAIAAFPNEQFYSGRLETADQNKLWTLNDSDPLFGIHIDGDEKEGSGHSFYNPDEAQAAAAQVRRLLVDGVDGSNIGVISAYARQIKEIKNHLRGLDQPSVSDVEVNTVDAFQGSEREAIIVSLVRSNERHDTGFLTKPDEGPRRLNVALTRAKKRLVVIGDWETLGQPRQDLDDAETCAPLYADLEDALNEYGTLLN